MSNRGMINKSIGICIKSRRTIKDFKQHELASKANISASHLSDIERGLINPGVDLLFYLAIALDTRPSQIILEAEEKVLPYLKKRAAE